jgi:hypothetical protein
MDMPPRCGDLAYMTFTVDQELVGKMAHIWVIRDEAEDFAGTHEEILQKADVELVPWPDQEKDGKPGEFYSGRMADFRGLDKKSYKDRMEAQKFELRIFVDDKHAESDDALWMEGYADAQESFTGANRVGIPLAVTKWFQRTVIQANGSRTVQPASASFAAGDSTIRNVGTYHIELKDGVVTITVKVKLEPAPGSTKPIPPKVFKDIKTRVESFWNGSSGYAQWVYHRQGCQRGKACRCSVIESQGKVSVAGCCKFPLRVKLEQGADNPVRIEFLSLWQRFKVGIGKSSGATASTTRFPYPEDVANTYAHEIGHMMGYPDQYKTGHVDSAAVDATGTPTGAGDFPIDNVSIMGGGMNRAKDEHINAAWIKDWVSGKTDAVDAISAKG